MIEFLFSALIFIMIAYIDASDIYKSNDKAKIIVYTILFFTASMFCIMLLMGIVIPNPVEPLEAFIVSIFGKE